MNTSRIGRGAFRIRFAIFVGKDRDQAAVTGIKIHVPFVGIVQIGLVKHERHAQHTFPKIDRGLTIRARDCDVMNALRLDFSHNLAL